MYIFVKDVVEKCTEKQEGARLGEVCQCSKNEALRVDFHGVMNVTEDFVCGFLNGFHNFTETKISYVRTKPFIKKKFQKYTALLR